MKKAIRFLSGSLALICAMIWGAIVLLTRTMPQQFYVAQGSELHVNKIIDTREVPPIRGNVIKADTMSAGSTYQARLNFLGLFPLKDVTVNVVDQPVVRPCGTPFGIKMFTDGVLVVGMTDVDSQTGNVNPAKEAGVKTGDVIVKINKKEVASIEDVANSVEQSGGKPLVFRIRRHNLEFDANFTPAKSVTENRWKAGLWVRDSSAGLGTMTFYDSKSMQFAGLGHAVCDVDTGEIIPISSGEIVSARIFSVVKGESGSPGELRGGFEPFTLGSIKVNSETGLFGSLNSLASAASKYQTMPVCFKQQVKTGDAKILTTIDGTTPEYFDITINQVRYNDSSPTRNMVITVTDKRLLELTGGIVQGMSGSPIIQDGKLVGAVTHVFVNDPKQGFGIFAENMLKSLNSVPASSEKTTRIAS